MSYCLGFHAPISRNDNPEVLLRFRGLGTSPGASVCMNLESCLRQFFPLLLVSFVRAAALLSGCGLSRMASIIGLLKLRPFCRCPGPWPFGSPGVQLPLDLNLVVYRWVGGRIKEL